MDPTIFTDNCYFCGALHKINDIYTRDGLVYRSVCAKCNKLVKAGELDPYGSELDFPG